MTTPLAFLLALLAAQALPDAPGGPIVYRVELARAGDTFVSVSIEPPEPLVGPVTLVIPRAVPMGYSQQDYDRYVGGVTATSDGGATLAVEREDGPRFRIGAAGTSVKRVAYRVDLRRMEREILGAADASRARPRYASLLGYSVFGCLEGHEARPIRLDVLAPPEWPVLTTLAPASPPPVAKATGAAAGFYALADAQVVMGPELRVVRAPGPVPLFVAAYAEGPADPAHTAALVARAMDALVAYFGSAPFPHYTAVVEHLKPVSAEHRYGFSMEHLDSSHYFLGADEGVTREMPETRQRRVLFNFVHHLAHAWIPKRAAGEGYIPFSWELAPVIDTIWFSEGFARYAAIEALADALPAREGAVYRAAALDTLRATVAGMPRFIREMPLVPLSRVASTRYSEDFRTGRTLFSRGALLAAELDERIRKETDGRTRLRDFFRHLVAWSAREKRGFRVDELPGLLREATGVEARDVWERALR